MPRRLAPGFLKIKRMKIYVIKWSNSTVIQYIFPKYEDEKLNKFFSWHLEYGSGAIDDIESWIRDYKTSFEKIKYIDLPEEIRHDFDFMRRYDQYCDFDDLDIFQFTEALK